MRSWIGAHQLIRASRDDGVALKPASVRGILPSIPESREGHHPAIEQVEGEWLLVLLVETLPFVKAGCGD